MIQSRSSIKLWSVFILLAGATALSASERMTPEVLAIKRTLPSVGNIHTEKAALPGNIAFAAEKSRKINGMGTGIVIDERGYLVTNYHVIADVDTIRVDLEDEQGIKSSYVARKVRSDREHDLAIIKIDGTKPFKVMPTGTSSDLMLGEKVIAIGNAFGYDGTATLGIISKLGRDVEANETVSYKNLIQTDAAINPGNSGGPLINMDGELIGINVAIRANSNRIGFTIAIDDARKIIARMVNLEHGLSHGLMTRDVKSGSIRMLVVDGYQPDGPAASAGLRAGDVVMKAGNVEVIDGVDLERSLLHRTAGDRVELVVKRADKMEKVTIALAQYTGGRASLANNEVQVTPRANNNDDTDKFWSALGLRLTTLPASDRGQLSKTKYRGGMRVVEVKADSAAAANGIQKSDILVGLDRWETMSVDNITWIINQLSTQPATTENQGNVKFYIVRDQQTKYGFLPLASTPRTANLGN